MSSLREYPARIKTAQLSWSGKPYRRSLIAFHLCGSLPQVVVLTQRYGQAFYHFLVENLSRITVVLDVLLENPDIKVTPAAQVLEFSILLRFSMRRFVLALVPHPTSRLVK